MAVAILANLALFSIVVSQPLFYLVVLTQAQRALSAPAYVELRQHIDPVMNRRIPVIYIATLITTLLLLVVAFRSDERLVLVTTAVALACLVADVVFMMRENLPINSVIDGWSTTSYPSDWETHRDQWFAIFGYRQVVLSIGFASLLVGAAFRS
jgi:hypothetical protein